MSAYVDYETIQEISRKQDRQANRRAALMWGIGTPVFCILVAAWLCGAFANIGFSLSTEAAAKSWIKSRHGGDKVTFVHVRSARLGINYDREQFLLNVEAQSPAALNKDFEFKLRLISGKPSDAVRIQYRAPNKIGLETLRDIVVFLDGGTVVFSVDRDDEQFVAWIKGNPQIEL